MQEMAKPIEARIKSIPSEFTHAQSERADFFRSSESFAIDQLMDITDSVFSRLLSHYEKLNTYQASQLSAMSISIVFAAIYLGKSTEVEAPIITDVYLDRYLDRIMRPPKEANAPALKAQLLQAARDNFMSVVRAGFESDRSSAIRYVQGLDNLVGVSRSDSNIEVTAVALRGTIAEAFRVIEQIEI